MLVEERGELGEVFPTLGHRRIKHILRVRQTFKDDELGIDPGGAQFAMRPYSIAQKQVVPGCARRCDGGLEGGGEDHRCELDARKNALTPAITVGFDFTPKRGSVKIYDFFARFGILI